VIADLRKCNCEVLSLNGLRIRVICICMVVIVKFSKTFGRTHRADITILVHSLDLLITQYMIAGKSSQDATWALINIICDSISVGHSYGSDQSFFLC
jgi:hypothetical protein